jgi:hypothetical protein
LVALLAFFSALVVSFITVFHAVSFMHIQSFGARSTFVEVFGETGCAVFVLAFNTFSVDWHVSRGAFGYAVASQDQVSVNTDVALLRSRAFHAVRLFAFDAFSVLFIMSLGACFYAFTVV